MKYKATVTIESEDDNQKADVQVAFDPPIDTTDKTQPYAYDMALRIAQAMCPSNIEVES